MDRIEPSRRRLLLAGGAAALLPGCASVAGGPSIGRVVIVGAGFGGATAARYLKLWGGNVDVTLVERQAEFVSCPISNLVLGGYRQMADVTRSFDGLRRLGVKLVRGEVSAVDVAARKLRLADGSELAWDRLILSPGVDFMFDAIGGFKAEMDAGRVLHAWKAGAQTVALRQQLVAMRDGGTVVIAIPKTPYRCPPGPYERACVVAAYLQAQKPKSKLLVMDANPEITSKKGLFEKAFASQYAGLLEYRPNSEVKEVSSGMARFEFEDIRAEVLNLIPPQRGGDIARSAGLLNMNQRWAGVNWLSMESTAAPGVHVLGDTVFAAPAMPKSGHMANQHAKLAAAAVIQLLKGEPVNPAPVLTNTCYSFVNATEAVHVASVHQYDAAEKIVKPVPGAGGVSAAQSQAEGRYAMAWAQNIWADTLG